MEAEETVQGTEEKHSRLRVKQLICESLNGMRITETILAAAICSLGRGMQGRKVPWKAQGWELEHRDCGAIRGELSYRMRGEARGDVREEVAVGNACAGNPGSRGGRATLQSHSQAVEPSLWPLCPHKSALDSGRPQREAGLLLLSRGREPGAVEKDRPQRRSDCSCERRGRHPERARAPSAETAGVPAHSELPEFSRSEQLFHLHAGSPLGQSYQRLEKALIAPYLL